MLSRVRWCGRGGLVLAAQASTRGFQLAARRNMARGGSQAKDRHIAVDALILARLHKVAPVPGAHRAILVAHPRLASALRACLRQSNTMIFLWYAAPKDP